MSPRLSGRLYLAVAEFSGDVIRADRAQAVVSPLNRLLASSGARWYVVQWRSADGHVRRMASRSCPRRILESTSIPAIPDDAPATSSRLVLVERDDVGGETIVCRAAFNPADEDTQFRRAVELLVRAALRRILTLTRDQRRGRMLKASAEGQWSHLFLFDTSGHLVDQIPTAWDPVPAAILGIAARLRDNRSRLPEGATFERGGLHYDVRHRWVMRDPPARGRALLVEARPKPSLDSFVVDQFAHYALTRREREIARLLLEGDTNQEVAAKLFVSADTVKTHCRHLFNKLGIGRRSELLKVLNRGRSGAPADSAAATLSGRALQFAKMSLMGTSCRGRYVRLDKGAAFFESLRDGVPIRIDKDAIGYCYAATNVLSIGFNRGGRMPLPSLLGPGHFDYCVRVGPRSMPFLSISL